MIETQVKGKQQLQSSGSLDSCSAMDTLSIKFIVLSLLVSDCCLASILSQFGNSCFIEDLLLSFAYSIAQALSVTNPQDASGFL